MEILQHCSTEHLIDYLEDRLDPTTLNQVSKHLQTGCHECETSLMHYGRIFKAVESLHWPSPTSSIHQRVISQYPLVYPTKIKPRIILQLRPALILISFLIILVFTSLLTRNPRDVYAGFVENISGTVEVLDPNAGQWKPVLSGQSIPVDSTIRTLSDSSVTISFPGGEKTLLNSETEIHLVSMMDTKGSWNISIELINGQAENLTTETTGQFTLKTINGQLSSDHAHFIVKIDDDGSVITDVFEGEVNALKFSEKSTLHKGQTLVFSSDKFATMGSPLFNNFSSIPSLMPNVPTKTTKTPSSIKPTGTPNPKTIPTPKSDKDKTETSAGSCLPGNSNGAGNSANANNSSDACK